MTDNLLKDVLKRLNIALSLVLNPLKEASTDQEKIQRLDFFGLTPSEISDILGSTNDKVSKQLYVIRKKKAK